MSTRQVAASALAACAGLALLACTGGAQAQAQANGATPAVVSAISQTLPTVAGVPTLLTVTGSGHCKYHLSHIKQGAPPAAQAQLTYSSTSHSPFPMSLRLFDATAAGTYTWTATGIEGCSGSASLTFSVR